MRGQLDARIVGVFSDKPGAFALQRVPEALRWSRRRRTFHRARPSTPNSPAQSRPRRLTGWSAPATCASWASASSTVFADAC